MTIKTSLPNESGENQPFAGEGRSNAMKAATIIGGSVLAAYGITRRDIAGVAMAAGGGYLAYRGFTGNDPSKLGKIRVAFTINRPTEEVFRFVRDPQNWSSILPGVELNSSENGLQMSLGRFLKSDIQITDERDGEYVAWSSLPNGFEHRGVLHVRKAPSDRGSEVSVAMEFYAPGGAISRALASFLGVDPEQAVREGLRRIKQLLEAGEVATTEGQPHGSRGVTGRTLRMVYHEPHADLASHVTKLAGD